MFSKSIIFLTATLSFSLHANGFGDPELGKLKSPSCIFCHSITGDNTDNAYPKISGQDATYLFNTMKAYQKGSRKGDYADMIQAQLSKLNDQDLRDIAAFYSSQK
ncbi:cytochrome c [Vibrio chagasii]|uniref:c-type cytochrome n=1 Tax=Vibrio chagasii TaxID=170679 RepID=UPI0038CD6809